MDGLYFLAMLGGMVWLAWWSAGGSGWSPFAIREETAHETDPAADLQQIGRAHV